MAAIKGNIDNLIGLKENVIIGKLIPVGTGMKRYRNTRLSTDAIESPVDDIVEDEDVEYVEDDILEDEAVLITAE